MSSIPWKRERHEACVHPLVHSFNKHIVSSCCAPSTELHTQGTWMQRYAYMELTGQGWTVTMSDSHSAGWSVLCWRKHLVLHEPRWGQPPRLPPHPTRECSLKKQAGHLRWRRLANDVGWGEEKNGRVHQGERAVPGRAKDIRDIHQTKGKLGAYTGPFHILGSSLKPASGRCFHGLLSIEE